MTTLFVSVIRAVTKGHTLKRVTPVMAYYATEEGPLKKVSGKLAHLMNRYNPPKSRRTATGVRDPGNS